MFAWKNEDKQTIIAGNFNQAIGGEKKRRFYREIGAKDAWWCHDHIPCNNRDIGFKRGSRCIDSIAISDGLMPFLVGHEVTYWNDKFKTDHRWHVIDLKLE